MPRNVYFSQQVRSEQWLYEDLIVESLKIYGQDVYYLPRTIVSRDMIMNEDIESQFNDAHMIEMYIENTEGFEGEGNLLSKFGMELRDEATFIVARRTWQKLVGFYTGAQYATSTKPINMRPMEGDLIYLPMSKSFFEISFVEHEQPFYQLSNLPVYKLQCRLFEYSSEDFDTNVAEINEIEADHAVTVTLNVEDINCAAIVGTRLYQILEFDPVSGAPIRWISGEVADLQWRSNIPPVINLYMHDIQVSDATVTTFFASTKGSISTYLRDALLDADVTCSASIVEVADLLFSNDNSAMNYEFEQLGNSYIDFSETNPFGEPERIVYTSQAAGGPSMDSDTTTVDSDTITMDQIS